MNDFKQKLISDIRVKLTEEFDRNFERKAFWPKRRYKNPKGSLLMVTGTLRLSIRSTTTRNGVRFRLIEHISLLGS
jgi:phage gpG-like protein